MSRARSFLIAGLGPSLLLASLTLAPGPAAAQATPPADEPAENPLEEPPQNPLERPLPTPWGGEYANAGGQVRLVLKRAQDGYEGQLTVGEETYPLRAREESTVIGPTLIGTFTVEGHAFELVGVLETARVLRITSGQSSYVLIRLALPDGTPATRRADLGGAEGAPTTEPGARAVDRPQGQEPVTRYTLPGGTAQLELPQGWEVARQEPGRVVLGIPFPSGVQEAIVQVLHGRSEAYDVGRPVSDVLREEIPRINAMLRSELGIEAEEGSPSVRRAVVGRGAVSRRAAPAAADRGLGSPTPAGTPAAYARWSGVQPDGRPVTIWAGMALGDERTVTVLGAVLRGEEQEYLPQLKRVLGSIDLGPPTRPVPGIGPQDWVPVGPSPEAPYGEQGLEADELDGER